VLLIPLSGSEGLLTLTLPDDTDHTPLPVAGVCAPRLIAPLLFSQTLMSLPAIAAEGPFTEVMII
jgi:hypothetical protein